MECSTPSVSGGIIVQFSDDSDNYLKYLWLFVRGLKDLLRKYCQSLCHIASVGGRSRF